jgi:predicted metal-dependent hydrolase
VCAASSTASDGELPLAARNALVGLLLDDLANARGRDPLVARALEMVVLAPGEAVAASVDHDARRVLTALRGAGLLAWAPSLAGAHPGTVRLDVAWQPVAVHRLLAYRAALDAAPRGADLIARLAQARVLFAARLFFEVHEVLEPPWQDAAGPDRDVLQGVIQAAVAWHHAARGNLSGALRLATSASVKLLDQADRWHGFPLRALHASVARFVEDLSRDGSGDVPELPWARDDTA